MNLDTHKTFLRLLHDYCSCETAHVLWHELEQNYSQPNRHYHNLIHIQAMLSHIETVEHEVANLHNMLFAIFYHDIIYEPTKTDNEHQSALYFENVAKQIKLSSYSGLDVPAIVQMIENTKLHEKSIDHDTNLLLDIDLSILGTPEPIYTQYSENIRKEYNAYEDTAYFSGRKSALESFLQQQSVFKTTYFYTRLEKIARNNIAHEIQCIEKVLQS